MFTDNFDTNEYQSITLWQNAVENARLRLIDKRDRLARSLDWEEE